MQHRGQGAGIALAERFVKITGTWIGARNEMHRIFGAVWCDQYPAAEFAPLALRYELRELTL